MWEFCPAATIIISLCFPFLLCMATKSNFLLELENSLTWLYLHWEKKKDLKTCFLKLLEQEGLASTISMLCSVCPQEPRSVAVSIMGQPWETPQLGQSWDGQGPSKLGGQKGWWGDDKVCIREETVHRRPELGHRQVELSDKAEFMRGSQPGMWEHNRRRKQVWEERANMRRGRRRMIQDMNEKLCAHKNTEKDWSKITNQLQLHFKSRH